MNLEKLKETYNGCISRSKILKEKYADPRSRGKIYQHSLDQLVRDISYYKRQLDTYGCKHSIWECTFNMVTDKKIFAYQDSPIEIVKQYKIYYAGIISDELIPLILLHYPNAHNIQYKLATPGTIEEIRK